MKARIRLHRAVIGATQVLALLVAAGIVFAVSSYFAMQMAIFGREITVPRILEMELEEAREKMAPLDLRLERVGERHDDLIPAGQILFQEPAPDTKLKRGRRVKVHVSLGPEQHVVPDLRGMPIPRASVLLRQDRLRLGHVAYAFSDTTADDQVMAQDPPAGARIAEDGQVDLLVSRGPRSRTWVMPDLVGRPLERARRFLEEGGFRLGNIRRTADPAAPPGRILRQYPLAGYPLHRDDLISLVVTGGEETS